MSARLCVNAPLVFRLHENTPDVVCKVLLERSWEEFDPEDWNLYWHGSGFRSLAYENILPWQKLNHYPKTANISRKGCLARNLRSMRGMYGPALFYGFSLLAFILLNHYTRYLEKYTKSKGQCVYWICKPVALSLGRGIFIFKDIKHLTYDSTVIVQKYLCEPFLISGYKFDMRMYVCVTSFNLESLDNLFSHLTNTSINKFSLFYTTAKESVGQGCKWTMSRFRSFLHSQDVNQVHLWQKISNIVTLTLLTMAPSVPWSFLESTSSSIPNSSLDFKRSVTLWNFFGLSS
ncbi:LOW QUALITY PROTEIN: probable tubulin polyglutamylase TTLL2 [Tachysurus vachellii]|uniref:LOW QUALITY PROTEIN: probable tubulin polyglutamylase TTLL2 n=1 Tax=Tachysurus vachellii TaxID=175792 RepID=UPI00296A9CC8|nr:LOW QUALITY PROTEIN: probable tubulin polyglutamylase TTLL2 [Tachysurus vachellii]